MVNVVIYLKEEFDAKELVHYLLNEKLIASASIDEKNVFYELVDGLYTEKVFSVITSQSKSLLFPDIVQAIEKRIGEQTAIHSTPIVASNKIFDDRIRSKTLPT